MDGYNPYDAPQAEVGGDPSGPTGEALTHKMVRAAQDIGPWARLFSVLAFLAVALMVCGGVSMFGFTLLGASESPMSASMAFIGLLYIVLSALYIWPGLVLHRIAGAARRARSGRAQEHVETVIVELHRLFRGVGILFVALLGLYLVGIAAAMVFGALGKAAG